MNYEALGFAFLLVLALLCWGVTLSLTARNHLREANALDLEEKVNARIEDRLSKHIAAITRARAPRPDLPQADVTPPTPEDQRLEMRRQRLSMMETMPEMDEGLGGDLPEQPLNVTE